MGPRANVRSLDTVRRFRPAVIRFEEDLKAALSSLRQELNRAIDWMDHDCPAYWHQRVQKGFDNVAQARTQLVRRQMITVAGRRPDCIEEEKALKLAKRHLEEAQHKVQVVRQWSIKVHRAADEYSARIGRIDQALGQNIPRLIAVLDRIIAALEAYATSGARSADAADSANVEIELETPEVGSEAEATPATAESGSAVSDQSSPMRAPS
jgi:hypothetical protein